MGIDEVPAPALDQDDWWGGKWAGGGRCFLLLIRSQEVSKLEYSTRKFLNDKCNSRGKGAEKMLNPCFCQEMEREKDKKYKK